jgi:hypothetical protein
VLLYPILTKPQHAELVARGRLVGRWRYVDPYQVAAYRWMVRAMERRGIRTGGRPPVWAWHSFDPPRRRKPDLRCSGHLPRGERGVRLVVEAPDALVLLSDFDSWHSVLNRGYLSLSEAEADRMDGLEARGRLTAAMVERSWERIFDLTGGDADWWKPAGERQIQACLPYFKASWVREATPFVARGSRC